jgi:hypothetical protein
MVKTRCSRQGAAWRADRIFLTNRECIAAKIEVTVRNGEITFTLRELETVPGAFKSGVGEGKIAYF